MVAGAPGIGGSRHSASGEGWWEAAWGAEDETVEEAWGVSEHSEGGRC